MEWQIIVALVIGIPIILFPLAYVWYLNIGGIYAALKKTREKRVAKPKEEAGQEREYVSAVIEALNQYPWHK
jgi:hypothetical protein